MIKYFDRFAKRRVRQQTKATNQRKFQRGLRSGLETLEQRQLLAADLVMPFETLYETAGDDTSGFTNKVAANITKVPHGPNAALALSANWTDDAAIEVTVKIDQNGDGAFTGSEVDSFKLADLLAAIPTDTATGFVDASFGGAGGMSFPVLVGAGLTPVIHDAEGAVYQAAGSPGSVSSMVLVVPVGSSAIDRMAEIEIRGGQSTEILSGVGVYHSINQADPLGGVAGKAHISGQVSTDLGPLGGFDPANDVALDAVIGRFGNSPGNSLTVNNGNTERFNKSVVINNNPPAVNGLYIGAGSTNSIGESGWAYGANAPFVLSHILGEVNGVATVGLLYDFGDAPDAAAGTAAGNYQTRLNDNGPRHAVTDATGAVIVGPYFGPTAPDAEADGLQNANATGDGADEDAIVYGNGTVASGVATPAGINAFGKFVTQSMNTSTGYLTVDIQGVSGAKPGYVSAFIDWNRDGKFTNANETILNGATPISTNGLISFPVTIPKSVDVSAGNSILRIRIHSDPCDTGHALAALGFANDGEVEDHQIVLVKGSEIHGVKYEDVDGSGTVTAADIAGMQGTNGVVIGISGSQTVDLFGNPLSTTLANPSDGKFWFNYLIGGTYTVTEDLTTTDINNDVGTLGPAGYDNLQGLVQSAALLTTGINVGTQGTVNSAPIFLNYIQGSIHGQKFEDINGNTTKESGESPIENVVFKLYKRVGTSNNWTFVTNSITDANGRYNFPNLVPGTYAVYEDTTSTPISGWALSTGQKTLDPGAGATAPGNLNTFTITSRKEFVYNAADVDSSPLKVEDVQTSLIFGNFKPGVITGQKFDDLNGNGVYDSALMFDKDGNGTLETTGETAFANITFELLDSTGAPVMVPGNILVPSKPASPMVPYTDKTDSNGEFKFINLKPGVYKIREVIDSQDTNSDTVNDYFTSNTNPGQGLTKDPMVVTFTVKSQTEVNLSTGSENGANDTQNNFSVMYDLDGNGTTDATGLPTSNSATKVSFDNSRWLNYVKGSIHGVKFHDLNGNGVFDDRVPGKATLSVIGGSGNQLMLADVSQVNHNFPYDATVTVNANTPSESVLTVKVVDIDVANQKLILSAPHNLTLSGGDDFVTVPTGDPAALAGVTIQLWKYVGVNTNNYTSFGAPVPVYTWTPVTEITNAHGEFWFNNLDPGRYAVREVHSVPDEYPGQSTSQALGSPHRTVNGQTVVDPGDDPNDPATGTITVLSRQEYQWEANQFGRPINVALNQTPAQLTTAFTPLAPNFRPYDGQAYLRPMDGVGGTANDILDVSELVEAYKRGALKTPIIYNGLEHTLPGVSGTGTLPQSLLIGNYKPVDIEGRKFHDLDGDQVKDDNEDGFEGVTFVLYQGNNPVLTPTTTGPGTQFMPVTTKTNNLGVFKFENVRPGTYTVREANAQSPGVPFQDTNNDGINDVAFQGLVLANNNASPISVTSGTNFNFSTLVDKDNNPATPMVPTHQWFNYVNGSIHGVKFEDIDGDGVFDDTRIVLAETSLAAPGLSDVFSDTSVKVADSSIFPTVGYPYQIHILNGSGGIAETLTVTNNSTATNTLTVNPRGVPVAHSSGVGVQGPTTVLPNVIPATLEGVAFQLWRFVGTRQETVANSNAQHVIYDWTLVNSATEFSDNHGEYWFTGLKPAIYAVRENLGIQMTRGMVGNLPGDQFDPLNGPTFSVANVVFTYSFGGTTAGTTIGIPNGASNTVAAKAIADALNLYAANNPTTFAVKASSSFNKITIFNPQTGAQVAHGFAGSGITSVDYDYTDFKQSTTQKKGSPDTNVPDDISNYTFNQSTIFGDNPITASVGAITVESTQEYVWKDGHHIMAVDGRIDPRLGTPGYVPQYPAPFNNLTAGDYNPSTHGKVDGVLDVFEKAWAAAKEVLKTPIVIGSDGLALQYGNYDPASIEGDKFIVNQFIGDTIAAKEPLPGIVMVLTGTDGAGTPIVPRTTVTDINGHFKFEGLRPGTYTVAEQATQDLNNDGVNDVNDGINTNHQGLHIDPAAKTVTVKSGQEFNFSDKVDHDNTPSTPAIPSHQWHNWIEVSFHGLKFHDLNADGKANDLIDHDNDDPDGDGKKADGTTPATPKRQAILQGVAFDIYAYTGMHRTNPLSQSSLKINDWLKVKTEYSDVHGEFWFTGLKPGIYTIREDLTNTTRGNFTGYLQSTSQSQISPIASASNPSGANPSLPATGAIANLNVRWTTGSGGIDAVPAWLDTDPGLGVTPSAQTSINNVNRVGYPSPHTVRSYTATGNVPGYNPPSYFYTNGEGTENGFIGGEYQWSNSTGNTAPFSSAVPYLAAAFQRPMDTNGNLNIDEIEKRDAIVGTALKQAGTLGESYGSRSLLWGNYRPVKIIGEKFEDLDGDGKYDANGGVFGGTISDKALPGIKFELFSDIDGIANGPLLPVTAAMLAGGTNSISPTAIRPNVYATGSTGGATFTANVAGLAGNDIRLIFNGTATINDVVGAWNGANLGNMVSFTGIDGNTMLSARTLQLQGIQRVIATTGTDGMFMFGNLVPGDYVVRETAKQDSEGDGVDDIAFQGLVLANNNAPTVTLLSPQGTATGVFNFSTPVDDNDPLTVDQPTHIWLNYVKGSIHGRKFHDINGDKLYNDVVQFIAQTTTAGVTASATTITVADASKFPSTTPFLINVGGTNNNGAIIGGEVMEVTSRAGNVFMVAARGNPVAHGATTVFALQNNPNSTDLAVIPGVQFDLYEYVRSETVAHPTNVNNPPVTRYEWKYVSSVESDVHGDYWFTNLKPGRYVVRENQTDLTQHGLAQSTDQLQGNPNWAPLTVPQVEGQPTSASELPRLPGFGDNPATAGTFIVHSRQEYVWRDDAHIMAVDGDGQGNSISGVLAAHYGDPGNPLYDPAFDVAVHGKADDVLDDFERAWAAQKQHLKVDPLATELLYGNYKGIQISGTKYIVEQFIGDKMVNPQRLEGIKMELLKGGTVVATTTTLSDGTFKFTHYDHDANGATADVLIGPGSWSVREAGQQDLNQDGIDDVAHQGLHIDAVAQSVAVTSGQSFDFSALVDHDQNPLSPAIPTHEWFNWIEVSFHGIKFHDLNADGMMNDDVDHDGDDPDGNGLKANGQPATPPRQAVLLGVRFDIYMYVGNHKVNPLSTGAQTIHDWIPLAPAITDVHGEFWFTELKPGIYTIRENLAASGNDINGVPYSSYYQSTSQTSGSPAQGGNKPLGENPTDLSTGALANLNVRLTGGVTGPVRGWIDTDPGVGVTPAPINNFNSVHSVGYAEDLPHQLRSYPAIPALNIPAYNPPTTYTGFIGGEYQWSEGETDVPYVAAAFQRAMNTNGNQNIDETEKRDAIVGTALKQAGLPGVNNQPTRSLAWGNYLPVKIIGDKLEDTNGDGIGDNAMGGINGITMEIFIDPDGAGGNDPFPLTANMLPGESNAITRVQQYAKVVIGNSTVTANNLGPMGSLITLKFPNNNTTVAQAVAAWNGANPTNQATVTVDGGDKPGPVAPIKLTGTEQVFATANTATGRFMFGANEGLVPGNYIVREFGKQDINNDGIDDVAHQGLVIDGFNQVLTNPNHMVRLVSATGEFNYSTLVDENGLPDANGKPTHVWLDYIEGSIHGRKFEDKDANGVFDPNIDRRIKTTTAMLNADLGGLYSNTIVNVGMDDIAKFPAPGANGYDIQIVNLDGTNSETLHVTAVNTGDGTITVSPRGVPLAHAMANSKVILPTANPPQYEAAVLPGVGFELWKWDGTREVNPPTNSGPFFVHDWKLVDVQVSDIHGEYWFTGLEPGKYSVRENLDLDRTVVSVGGTTAHLLVDGNTFTVDIDGVSTTYEAVLDGALNAPNSTNIPVHLSAGDTPAIAAAKIAKVVSANPRLGVYLAGNQMTFYIGGALMNVNGNFAAGALSFNPVQTAPLNLVQSSPQAKGSPDTNVPDDTTGLTGSYFQAPTTFLGSNPGNAASSTITVASRQEYGWKPNAHIMPMEGAVNPNLVSGVSVHPTAVPTLVFNSSVHGKWDGNFDQFEQLWGVQQQALKVGVNVGAALDYGNYTPVTIMGHKFHDINGDGKLTYNSDGTTLTEFDHNGDGTASKTEGGFAGIVFELRNSQGQPVLTANGAPHIVTVGSDGKFTFSGVKPGSAYTVAERAFQDINGDLVNDTTQGLHLSAVTQTVTPLSGDMINFSANVDLDNNPETPPQPFYQWFNHIEGSIHGVKFQDYNRDGIKTSDEPYLQGVTFDIYKFREKQIVNFSSPQKTIFVWDLVKSSTSNSHGEFWFTDLHPGTYTVRENLGANPVVKQTTDQALGNPNAFTGTNGSILVMGEDPTKSETSAIVVLSAQEHVSRVGGHLMPIDANGNSTIDPSEWQTAYKKAALKYSAGFNPGDVYDPAKVVNGLPVGGNVGINDKLLHADNTGGGTAVNGVQPPTAASQGSLIYGNNWLPGSYHGLKYEDLNGNGVYNGPLNEYDPNAEPGIANILVGLIEVNAQGLPVKVDVNGNPVLATRADGTPAITKTMKDNPATTANETGHFWIDNLVPGKQYKLVEFLNGKLVDHDNNTATPSVYRPAHADGKLFVGVDAASANSLGISDSNNNNVPDGLEGMVQSSTHTGQLIGALQAHVYTPQAFLDGYGNPPTLTADPTLVFKPYFSGVEYTLPIGPPMPGQPLPVHQNMALGNYVTGSIHGLKFLDKDANGIYNPVDGTHPNWDMPFEWAKFGLYQRNAQGALVPVLDGNNAPIVVASNPNGEFWIENLKPGDYVLRELIDIIDRNAPNGFIVGNGIMDYKEGLMASTHVNNPFVSFNPQNPDYPEWSVSIGSGQEFVWSDGAAHLSQSTLKVVEPDSAVTFPQNNVVIGNKFPNVTLTVNGNSAQPVLGVMPLASPIVGDPFNASTGFYTFGSGNNDPTWQNDVFHADFSVAVNEVSIDVIANDSSDQGYLRAFNANNIVVGFVVSSELNLFGTNKWQTLKISAPGIVRIEAGGYNHSVGLDNLRYNTVSLKEEVLAGPNGVGLKFGNFYAGGVGGIKTQQGSNNPAPNITMILSNSDRSYTTTTSATGAYFFKDVVPGVYTLSEAIHTSVLEAFSPRSVTVGHATVVVHQNGAATLYPGLQTEGVQSSLKVSNLVQGSVHGWAVRPGTTTPVAGVTFRLVGDNGFTATATSGSDGQFHFNGLDPRNAFDPQFASTFIVEPVPAIVGVNPVSVQVLSGQERAAFAGQTNTLLLPGQFEVVTPQLKINIANVGNTAPTVTSATVSLLENSPASTNVVNVVANDPDAGNTLTYAITAGNASGAFTINPNTGQITVANSGPLNLEVTPQFVLTVQATDNHGASGTGTVTVNLLNVNEPPTANNQTISLNENTPPGTLVTTVVASDPDAGDSITYSIIGQNSGAFVINPTTGAITVADSSQLDFENHPQFVLTVKVQDVAGLSATATVIINLNNVGELGPAVVDVWANSTLWEPIFRDWVDGGFTDSSARGYKFPKGANQMETLPWTRVDQLKIRFSQDVGASLQSSDFNLVPMPNFFGSTGIGLGQVPTAAINSYDAGTFTVTLDLSFPLQSMGFDLKIASASIQNSTGGTLDGNWTNGVTLGNSGDGVVGGDFSFRIFVLPGDATDGTHGAGPWNVNSTDDNVVTTLQNSFLFNMPGTFQGPVLNYNPRADFNGSGNINSTDSNISLTKQNTFLVQMSPVLASIATSEDDAPGNDGGAISQQTPGVQATSEPLDLSEIDNVPLSSSSYEAAVDEAFGDAEDGLLDDLLVDLLAQ